MMKYAIGYNPKTGLARVAKGSRVQTISVPQTADALICGAIERPSKSDALALSMAFLKTEQKLSEIRRELMLLRDACDVGAILSRRIKDESGRVRHVDAIVDDMIKLIDG